MSGNRNIRKPRFKAATSIAALLVYGMAYSQMTVSIDNVSVCEDSIVHVPVRVLDFENVNTFTFHILADTALVSFLTHSNPHPGLVTGALLSNAAVSGEISVTWFSMSPVTITDGKLFELALTYKQGSAILGFADNCQVTQSIFPVEEVDFVNGEVIEGGVLPLITEHPQSVSAYEGDEAVFSVSSDIDNFYQWQSFDGNSWIDLSNSSEHFQDVDTHELRIRSVSLDLNNVLYRCVVNNIECQVISDSAVLLVSPLGIKNPSVSQPAIFIYPNPGHGNLNYHVSSRLQNASIAIINILGKQVYSRHFIELDADRIETIFTGDLQAGLYFVQLIQDKAILSTTRVIIK